MNFSLEQPQLLLVLAGLTLLVWRIFAARGNRQGNSKITKALEEATSFYNTGDYKTALAKTEGLTGRQKTSAEYEFFRSSLLLQLGKCGEAAEILQHKLAEEGDSTAAAQYRQHLGLSFMELERFNDASDCFEHSARNMSNCGAGDRAMAEVLLRQGGRHSEALRRAKIAVEKDRAARAVSQEIRNITLAWATASAVNDRMEVDKLAKEAIPLAEGVVPSLAKVYFDFGCAYAALSEAEKSTHYFAEAARVDAQGHWGRMGERLVKIAAN